MDTMYGTAGETYHVWQDSVLREMFRKALTDMTRSLQYMHKFEASAVYQNLGMSLTGSPVRNIVYGTYMYAAGAYGPLR